MSKRPGSSKPSLKELGTPKPAAPQCKKSFTGPPMLGFNTAETEFFLAGNAMEHLPESELETTTTRGKPPARRAPLRALVSALVAGAAVLAWYGPGKVAAPVVLSHVQISAPAQTSALARANAIFAPPRVVSQAPAPSPPKVSPTVRARPHPATATRARSRHR